MFYGQCWKCGERWALGTASTCKCLDETPKRKWVGLTDDDIYSNICDCVDDGTFNMQCAEDYAKAIEAKLKEKNT